VEIKRRQITDLARRQASIFRAQVCANFLLRWVLANIVGWSIGLYLSAWSLSTPVLCLGGAFAGLCVGAAQWWALKPLDDPLPNFTEGEQNTGVSPISVQRDWIGLTIAGAILGAIPALSAWVLVMLGLGLGIAIAGAIFGAGIGVAQYFILQRSLTRAGWWITANLGGGALCALLTLAPLILRLPIGLPLGLLLGTALYGYITGRVLVWLEKRHESSVFDANP
jgi:hypothetical protein